MIIQLSLSSVEVMQLNNFEKNLNDLENKFLEQNNNLEQIKIWDKKYIKEQNKFLENSEK